MKRAKINSLQPVATNVVTALTALLCALSIQAQTAQRSPLVIGITVEGLSDEILSLLEPQLSEGGFRRLINNGARLTDVRFGPGIDPTSATAIVYTGASPMVNGIPAAEIYNTSTKQAYKTLHDPSALGNFTDETYSPKAIKVSTLADELRVDSDGEGSVYAVGTDPQMTIIAAGHAANGAYWIYDHTGNWSSTTYYRKDLPSTVTNRNYRTPLYARLDTMKWTPSVSMTDYPFLSASEQSKPFRHTYPQKQFDRFIQFKASPLSNREVTDLGIDLITSAHLGADRSPDMLNISYTVLSPEASRAETMDMYLRLDSELERLFAAVDRASAGTPPTIFLTGLPSPPSARPDDKRWRIPTGEYSIRKAMSLLGMYLMATHGNGDWLSGYHNKQFFLNRKLITDSNLNLADFRTEVADFLARMAGVSNVFTIDDIIAARAGDDPTGLKRNTSVEHCGDVFVEINPGWVITDDPNTTTKRTPATERTNATRIPAFILAPNVKPKRIDTPVDARAIAPAVAHVMRIRPPNAAANGSLKVD